MIFGLLDWILLALAAVVFLFAGFTGRGGGPEGFLLSGRSLRSPLSGSTIAASKIGAGAIITYTALVFQFGLGALWLFLGYICGYALFYAFAIRLRREAREARFFTLADFFSARYGPQAALALGGLTAVSLFGWVITNLVAGGRILEHATGGLYIVSVALMLAVILPYLVAGGFRSVVRTDAIQYGALILVLTFLAVAVVRRPTDPGLPELDASMPIGLIASFFVTGLFFPMGSTDLWQRVYATRDDREFRRAIVIASISFLAVGAALSVIGLRLRALVPLDVAPELALIDGITVMLGPGFAGLVIIALLAAILSSADTFIYTTSAVVVHDFLDRARSRSGEMVVKLTRFMIPLVAALGFGLSMVIGNVVEVTFLFAGLTMSIGVISMAAWTSSSLTGPAIIVAVVSGFVGVVTPSVLVGVSVFSAVGGLIGATLGLGIGVVLSRSRARSTGA